jgi:hypothetical protein
VLICLQKKLKKQKKLARASLCFWNRNEPINFFFTA